MSCQEFWNTIPPPGGDAERKQDSHLAECAECAALWERHRHLATGLRHVANELRHLEAPARVEAGLTAAYRMQMRFQKRRPAAGSWWKPVAVWVAAAAAMVAMAVFLQHGRQPESASPGTVAAPNRPAPASLEWASLELGNGLEEDTSGLGEGFIRLPNAARIRPDEDVNVVRVEVRGSSLIAMGFAVSEERASQPVLADVALGGDGMARAVRFVNSGSSDEE